LFLPLFGRFLAFCDHLADCGRVEAVGLGIAVYVLNVQPDGVLLIFQTLDFLDICKNTFSRYAAVVALF
jgi:hypothetical protein